MRGPLCSAVQPLYLLLCFPAGQPVKVLAIGGSVTAGHGLNTLDAAYPARFGEFLNAAFPHPETEVLNRAIGGSTSSAFSLCFNQLVPQASSLAAAMPLMPHAPRVYGEQTCMLLQTSRSNVQVQDL